jgi:hypothetical protein
MSLISDDALSDPGYWRERAKQLRAESGPTRNGEETRLLLELADMHEKFTADMQLPQSSKILQAPVIERRVAIGMTTKLFGRL